MPTLRRLFLPLALLLALAGCDSTDDGGTFFLPAERVSFEFAFDGSALTPGQFTEIASNGTESLVDYIVSENFTIDDVVAVRLREGSGQITIGRPQGVSIDFIDQARLRLTQGTRAPLTVASDTEITPISNLRANLDIETADLAAFAITGPFGALLDLDPVAEVEGSFLVTVTFDAVVEVQP